MNVAEYIVKRLEELGVNDYFGLPSDYNFNILYTIKNNPNLKWIGCTNGLNAGYAADGYARIKGYGALVTAYGGGELSSINAIAASMAENVPVINIVGLPSTKYIKEDMQYNLRNVDYKTYMNTFSSVVAAFAFLEKDNAKQEIDRVLGIMIKEKKPVYLAIPSDIALLKIDDKYSNYDYASNKDVLNDAAQKIAEKIAKSKKPVIIGDVLIKRFDAEIEYKDFVMQSRIPVSNFLMGLNLIDMDYEKYIGGYFGKYRNPISQKYIEESDCLIAVGTIYNDINAFGFNLSKKINDGIAIYGNYTYIDGELYEDIKMSDLLEAITKLIPPKNIEIDKPNIGYKQRSADVVPLTTDYVYSRIQSFIKENDIVISDIGSITYGIAQMRFLESVDVQLQTIWGSIGWATPAALGASIAKPKSRVVLITGDGAHQVTGMEIGTMLRYGVKPIVIVMNNNGYATERLLSRDSKEDINDVISINYSKFARVFDGDVWSTKVSTSEDFDKALKVTQIMNKMCYIEVYTDALDTPLLTQDVVYSKKEKVDYKPQIETLQVNDVDIEEIIKTTPSSGFEYETIVHKGIAGNN